MITPRILFRGDPTEAVKWSGLAQDFGRSTFAAGIISKVWQVSAGVTIRVRNAITAKICKVWITAGSSEIHGYQFYTTSPTVEWAYWQDEDNDFCPGGSMVFSPTPVFPRDPLGYQASFTPAELAAIKLYAYPTHTLVEDPPQKLVNGELVDECPYTPMPETVGGVNGLNQIMNQAGTFKVTEAWQINGIHEPVIYTSSPKYDIVEGFAEPQFTGYYRNDNSLFTAWTQLGAQIFSYGLYEQTYYPIAGDVGYDTSPQKVQRRMFGQMPDADWPQRACITQAGGRWFIILHAADDEWCCWPYLPKGQLDYSISANAPPEWKAQAYKANVPESYVRRVRPEYPDWVYSTGNKRRDFDPALRPEPEPRVTFCFSSDGKKAIAAMVERVAIGDVSEEAFRRVRCMNPDQGLSRSRGYWYVNKYNLLLWYLDTYAPKDEATDVSIEIDASKRLYGTTQPPGKQPSCYDRKGIVELVFSIDVDPETNDYTFQVALGLVESPDDLEAYGCGALVDVAYAAPMLSYPNVNSVTLPGVNRDAQVTDSPLPDEVLTAFLTLYQTESQKKFDLGMYCSSNTAPSKSKISFYKDDDYQSATNPILELPLSQRHGPGYVGNTYTDPDTGEPIGLPVPAHAFVYFPIDSNYYEWPYDEVGDEEDEWGPRYVYDAWLEYMDLSTLSFHYTARVNYKTTDTVPFTSEEEVISSAFVPSGTSRPYKRFNLQTEMHNVYVFGKIAQESFVGYKGDHTSYLRGFCDKAISEWPGTDEVVIEASYRGKDIEINYAEASEDATSTAWWLNGACLFCVYQAIADSVFDRHYNGVDDFPYTVLDRIITEEEAAEILYYAVYGWGEYLAGNEGTRYFDPPEPPIPDQFYGKQNPFSLMSENVDLDLFIEQSAFVMMLLCNFIHKININNERPSPGTGFVDFNDVVFDIAFSQLSRPIGENFISPNIYDLSADFDLVNDIIYIKNYDWGVHLYNHYMMRRVSLGVLTREYGNIVTTNEGHYSYYYKDHYVINEAYTVLVIWYSFIGELEMVYRNGNPFIDIRTRNDETISGILSFDWKLVDGVGWYCGLVKADHLSLYNMAFSQTWREAQREDGRSPPYALASELPITTKYTMSNYRPSFVVFLSNVGDGELLYRPHKGRDDYYYTLQLEAYAPENFFFNSTGDFNGYFAFDPRQYRKHLRLSPLFF
jgi:hypothetical protein